MCGPKVLDGDLRKTVRTLKEKVSLFTAMEKERVGAAYQQALKVKSKAVDLGTQPRERRLP